MITNFYNFINEARSTIWTKEILQDEVNKYETRIDFKNNNPKAYQASYVKKFIDELFKNHPNKGYSGVPPGYWSNERLQDEANKYKTRLEFKKKSPAYSTALAKKLIDKLFNNHYNNGYSEKKYRGDWTNERLQDAANKCENRKEFREKFSGAYSAASNKNLVNDLFKNHENNGYIDKEEWKENSYVIYSYEIEEFNSAYVGLTNNIKRRDREHLFSEKEKMSLFCKENDIPYPKYKILEENLTSIEAQRQENYWEKFYKNNGWGMFNIAKTGSLGAAATKWNKKSLQREANKYKNRLELYKKNRFAYNAAQSKKILDELFKDHENNGLLKNKNGYWTEEKLQKEANKYNTRVDFYKKSYPAYSAAFKLGILDDIFKNHSNNGRSMNKRGYWSKERLQELANKYMTRRDFQNNNSGQHSSARQLGILDDLFKNHPNQGYTNKIKK